MWGAELQGELAYRTRAFYVGPTFSAGYLHLRQELLDERDFASDDPASDPIVLERWRRLTRRSAGCGHSRCC